MQTHRISCQEVSPPKNQGISKQVSSFCTRPGALEACLVWQTQSYPSCVGICIETRSLLRQGEGNYNKEMLKALFRA